MIISSFRKNVSKTPKQHRGYHLFKKRYTASNAMCIFLKVTGAVQNCTMKFMTLVREMEVGKMLKHVMSDTLKN